ALHKLQLLIEKGRQAYDAYEFHVIYHALYNYCTLDLSAFYLDILKDRLYTSPPRSVERKSAQSVLHMTLDALARLMAPILPFTSDEIWQYMPVRNGRESNIHLALLPEVNADFIDDALADRWELLLEIRGEATKALEAARARKLIGHPLNAAVTISAQGDIYDRLQPFVADLRSLLIVSKATVVKDKELKDAFSSEDIKGLRIEVKPAPGDKCERCWVHDTTVGSHHEQPTICQRCKDALDQID
ncbi:MAG: class I tRNA ligase family protein, partial [Deltaproteobacteria bacterium]|nr:class I tRNA ligase family protein [Deltaproteobacteria bacterium]